MTQEAQSIASEVFARLDAALAAATPAAQHAYAVLVRQQIVEGGVILGGWLVAVVGLIVSVRSFQRAVKDVGSDESIPGGFSVGFAVAVVAMSIALVFFGIPGLLNPEYGAIRELLEIVK